MTCLDCPQALHSENEALAIGNVIRAAVGAVMNMICSTCNHRVWEHQRMVAYRVRETRRLESKLERVKVSWRC